VALPVQAEPAGSGGNVSQRGLTFTHETVRDWAMKLAPLLADTLRQKRRGAVGTNWYVDETYIKVQGRWSYLYRAIDQAGNLIDAQLRNTHDLAAAEAFFRSVWRVTGVVPARITTDGHDAYPHAIRAVFGDQVTHRTNRYLNNRLEQDHRGIKQRYRPTGGLRTFRTAAQFGWVFDELRGNAPLPLVAIARSLLTPEEVQHGPDEVMFGLMFVDALVVMRSVIVEQLGDPSQGFLDARRLPPSIQRLQTLGVIQVVISKQSLVVMGTQSQRERRLHAW
jgi:transposase-like protein